MVRELQTADEYQQLISQNQLVAILLYSDAVAGPIPHIFSDMSEQFNHVAYGQVNADLHPDILQQIYRSSNGQEIQVTCALLYRGGNLVDSTGGLDPMSAPPRIAGLLQGAMV